MIRKQKDYGPSNISKFGELGVIIRLSDKVERLITLTKSESSPNEESLEDSWIDVIGYGIIGLAIHRGWWGLPVEKESND